MSKMSTNTFAFLLWNLHSKLLNTYCTKYLLDCYTQNLNNLTFKRIRELSVKDLLDKMQDKEMKVYIGLYSKREAPKGGL